MESDKYLNTSYLDTIANRKPTSWTVEVSVGSQVMNFKIDTGAKVTAISEQAYQSQQKATRNPGSVYK